MALTTNKYRNKKIKNAYGTFDSIKEYKRFLYLSVAQKKGLISELTRQKKSRCSYRRRTNLADNRKVHAYATRKGIFYSY